MTPPLSREHPRNFQRPTGMGYSSSDSLDHQPVQSGHYCDSAGLASTPKLSSISGAKTETLSVDGSARTSSSREVDFSGELSVSNASDMETEWVEQDEPGVYITIRALPGGTRELRRVRFRYVGFDGVKVLGGLTSVWQIISSYVDISLLYVLFSYLLLKFVV